MQRDQQPSTQRSAQAVEDAYVALQDHMRTYRQARDQGNHAAGLPPEKNPVVVLQDAVQTFFQFIRPFVKGDGRLAEYWRGAIATHPDTQHRTIEDAKAYYLDNSVGVWQIQRHTGNVTIDGDAQQPAGQAQTAVADGGSINPGKWHKLLNLPDTTRILRVEPAMEDDPFDGFYYVQARFAVLGLREIPRWTIGRKTQRTSSGGFMSGETSTETHADPEPARKVETAARMLIEVADELDAIATYQPRGDQVRGTPVPDPDQ